MSDYDRYLFNEVDKHYTDERDEIYTCACCDEPIRDGDEYYEVETKKYCLACVEERIA